MDTPQAITHVSLCAGYGGIDLGLARAVSNLRTIAFSEIEAFACANLVAKMEAGLLDPAPIWTDVKTFPWSDFRGKVDILSGGFPCQPFSTAGKREGDEDPRHLFPHILRGITECQPHLVFLENVEGIISAKLVGNSWRDPAGTPVLLHVLRELERVGYRATAGVFSSAEIGASHRRKRVFILAMANPVYDGHNIAKKSGGFGSCAAQGWLRKSEGMGPSQRNFYLRPLRPGRNQWGWEPPRVLADSSKQREQQREEAKRGIEFGGTGKNCISMANSTGSNDETNETNETQVQSGRRGGTNSCKIVVSPLGGDADGVASWMDYAELSETVENRVDELRLLGNRVDPEVAEKAFRTLYARFNIR